MFESLASLLQFNLPERGKMCFSLTFTHFNYICPFLNFIFEIADYKINPR
jgi:hypothetical protein